VSWRRTPHKFSWQMFILELVFHVFWYCLYYAFVLFPLANLSVLVPFSSMRQRENVLQCDAFPGNPDALFLTLGGPGLRTFTSWNLAFDFGRNTCTSTLNEFIGYADLTDFREISPEHSRDNDDRKCVGNFNIQYIFSRGIHLRNRSRIF